MSKMIDLTGKRFGRLVVLRRAENDVAGRATWLCECDCGEVTIASGKLLRRGEKRSCGCLQREASSVAARRTNTRYGENPRRHVIENKSKHGDVRQYGSYSRLYHVWRHMKERCYYPKADKYPLYGGRGITVCDEWRTDFAAFERWAMTNGYDPDAPRNACTIDRINPDGNYEPSNCRFVGAIEQRHNRRDSRQRRETLAPPDGR